MVPCEKSFVSVNLNEETFELTAMITNIHQYLESLATFLDSQEWEMSIDAARLLSVTDSHVDVSVLQIEQPEDIGSLLRHNLEQPWDSITAQHLRLCWLLANERYDEAFATQTGCIQTFNKEILQKRKDENWFLPILYKLCSDLRYCAKAADLRPSARAAEKASYYERASAPIMDCFRSCVADARAAPENTKKVSMLNLTNQLFRIYFRINKLNLLKPLIRNIDNCGGLYEQFSLADRVTYQYFLGRKAMFDSDLKTSEKALTYAFRNCPADSRKNKRLILMYLIPVKMLLGHMPTPQLLEKYDLMQFLDVSEAVKEGNLIKLDEALLKHEHFFIACGVFLMLEKLKIIGYRTLLRKICQILAVHQVPLDAFLVALKMMKVEDVDMDETACIVANLIYQGKIKGYISHQHLKLVISKKDPFPPLSSVTA